MKKLIYFFLLFFLCGFYVKADEKLVNIYLFHSDDCVHCKNEIELLNELEKDFPNIRVYKYEISDNENSNLFGSITNLLDVRSSGVPFTVIGAKYYNGFSMEYGKKTFVATIEYYSKYGYKDVVGEFIGNIELPSYEIDESIPDINSFIKNYGNYKFRIPLLGDINTNELDLSFIIVLASLSRIFNIYMLFMFLFLYSFFIILKEKRNIILFFSNFFVSFIVFVIFKELFFSNFIIKNLFVKICILIFVFGFLLIFKKNKVRNNKFFIIFISIIISILFGVVVFDNNNFSLVMFKNILYLNNVSFLFEVIYILLYYLLYICLILLIFMFSILFCNKIIKYKKIKM